VRHLAAILAATHLVAALFLSIGLSRSFASTGHNCAPAIPPPVPGALVNPAATPGTLFINEVLLQPHSIWNCSETGGYFSTRDAWIELYNPQNQPLNLYAAHAFIDMGLVSGRKKKKEENKKGIIIKEEKKEKYKKKNKKYV